MEKQSDNVSASQHGSAYKSLEEDYHFIKGSQWITIYFCVQFTYTILNTVVFVQKYLDLIFTVFFLKFFSV